MSLGQNFDIIAFCTYLGGLHTNMPSNAAEVEP